MTTRKSPAPTATLDAVGPDKTRSSARAEGYRVEALGKGLKILSLFAQRQGPLRLTDVTRLAGIPMPTAYRLVHTLVEDGFLERLDDGQVRPGPTLLALAFATLRGLDVVQVASGPLHELARATGQTVNLGVLRADRVVYMERLRNSDLVTANLQVGSSAPAYCTSMGKLLLAFSSSVPDSLHESEMGVGQGPNAARDLAELERRLVKIRRDGWAVQDQEYAPGLRSVAGPVRDAGGNVVAAVNVVVQAPNWTVKDMLAEFLQPLLRVCTDISRRLGYTGSPA